MQLLEWQNLIFLLPIALGALYLLLMAMGTGFGEQGDVDVDQDAGLALEQDMDVDQGVEFDQGGDVDHGLETAHAGDGHVHAGALGSFLGVLGIGRVPLSILMMSYCFVWGAVGLVCITLLGASKVWSAVVIAAVAAVLVTRHLATGLAWLIPSVESHYTPPRQLVGLTGKVLLEVTETSGRVRLHDERNNLRDLPCRVPHGAPPIPADHAAVLLRYDAQGQVFVVEPMEKP